MMASPLQGLIRPEGWDYMRECLDVTSCRISMWKFGGLEFKGSNVWGQLVASIILPPVSLVSLACGRTSGACTSRLRGTWRVQLLKSLNLNLPALFLQCRVP